MIRIINILLTIGVFVAGFFLYKTIQEPIKFNAEFKKRDAAVISKLSYIRDLQMAYKDVNKDFAGSFDSLAIFVRQDSMSKVRIIGDPDQLDAQGNPVPVVREIIKIPVRDSMMNPVYDLDRLADIPNVPDEQFALEKGKVERGRIQVPVFEVRATYPQMLKGLNKNYIDPDLVRKVGSLEEPNYNGNWGGK